MRLRRLVAAATLLTAMLLITVPASARPLRDLATGGWLSCPDPSVVDAHVGRYRYYLACTSDRNRDAFPIRGSNDLIHWHFVSYVLPTGRHPWWALPPPRGRYWAPAIYRIKARWIVYFAASYDASKVVLQPAGEQRAAPGTMVIGVASARSLAGPWHTSLLHWRGQFNAIARNHETYGGVIDPSEVQDPRTGQRYLFWAEQHSSIWAGTLSADGLTLQPQVNQVLWTAKPWECRAGSCTVEGPEEYYRQGWFYLFYSGASTWTGTYAVGIALGRRPLSDVFVRPSSRPILSSGRRWIGPGGCSAPVSGPDGRTYLFYHASTALNPSHISAYRYLLRSPLHWTGAGARQPRIGGGHAG